ncbi:L-seryl-tRNA(Sec) selenium transferase [Desulfohalobium retbaense]|uniref:L-seryl-tRNA(Sec) selenium transferase n=1 Tax=Desulfohalobium retbaense (strain ATCC 49708 / DSM 5692 / JCM 16813 / HR100) TaxID=485915 RepID=C8X0V5_DESRD|nr:L-seryl-tRNA(Sec) selenium transferase [Desulfohalobium retbaense]ACV68052.1 L-seryl-tRNA selenium transferase [Desulfohalobium retbaense DSM 5692]
MKELFRKLPATDDVLRQLEDLDENTGIPRPMLRDAVTQFLDRCREAIRRQEVTDPEELALTALLPRAQETVRGLVRPHFRRVINATGVVVHTNLGRSLLARAAREAVEESCRFYSNLEFALETGKRGSRYSHVESLLCSLTGAEAALVVNNNAAAVLLVLDTLVKGKEAVVSRGQLVEIGGSFRIPDVMAKSGGILREVGTTNRTHLSDYEQAIGPETGALMKVHTSNYKVIGFHKEVGLRELAVLGREYDLPVIEDLGSGNLFDFTPYVPLDEPTAQSVLREGASVVTFSGDKLLGGPQAGVILGRKDEIERIKRNPLNRALRIDKMTLAALEATLRLYTDPARARREIPTLAMITLSPETIQGRAKRLASTLRRQWQQHLPVRTRAGSSRVGGGASPEKDLPTTLVQIPLPGNRLEPFREALLQTDPPLVGRIEDGAFCLDPRTLQSEELRVVPGLLEQARLACGIGGGP